MNEEHFFLPRRESQFGTFFCLNMAQVASSLVHQKNRKSTAVSQTQARNHRVLLSIAGGPIKDNEVPLMKEQRNRGKTLRYTLLAPLND